MNKEPEMGRIFNPDPTIKPMEDILAHLSKRQGERIKILEAKLDILLAASKRVLDFYPSVDADEIGTINDFRALRAAINWVEKS